MAFTVSIDQTTSPVAEGAQLDVTATVENTGADPAQKEVALTVGDSVRDSTSVNLENGQSSSVTLSWQTRSGDAGEYGAAVSSPDDTDTAVVDVEADTEVSVSITGTNAPVTEGEPLYVDVEAQNLKGDTIAQTIIAGLSDPSGDDKIKDKAADTERVVLDSNETREVTLEIGPGTYRRGNDATYDREIWVGSETDTAATTVTVSKPPQFDVTIESTTSPVTEGDTLQVTATIENTGGLAGRVTGTLAAKDYNNTISNVGALVDTGGGDAWKEERFMPNGDVVDDTGLSLEAGESQQVTLDWDPQPGDSGDRVLSVAAIPPWEEDEWDGPVFVKDPVSGRDTCDAVERRSGGGTTTVTVSDAPPQTPRFDVAIDSTNAPVTEGEDLEVTATVTNTGGVAGTANIALTGYAHNDCDPNRDPLYLSKSPGFGGRTMERVGKAELLADMTGDSLASGESKTVTLTWNTVPGDGGDRVVGVSAIPPWEEDEWDGPVFSVRESGDSSHVDTLAALSPEQVGADTTAVAIDRHGPMKTGRFEVQIDGSSVPGWQEVKIPARSIEQGSYREGNNPEYEKKVWGQPTFDDLEMERGVKPGDTRLRDWFDAVQAGQVDQGRKSITVTLLDEEGSPIIQWEFEKGWVKEYSPPDLDASADGEIATEEITIAYDEMIRTEA